MSLRACALSCPPSIHHPRSSSPGFSFHPVDPISKMGRVLMSPRLIRRRLWPPLLGSFLISLLP